jgi:hypothetical protein
MIGMKAVEVSVSFLAFQQPNHHNASVDQALIAMDDSILINLKREAPRLI